MTVPWPQNPITPSNWTPAPQMPYHAGYSWRCGQCGGGVSGYYSTDMAEQALLEHMAYRCLKRGAAGNGAGAEAAEQ